MLVFIQHFHLVELPEHLRKILLLDGDHVVDLFSLSIGLLHDSFYSKLSFVFCKFIHEQFGLDLIVKLGRLVELMQSLACWLPMRCIDVLKFVVAQELLGSFCLLMCLCWASAILFLCMNDAYASLNIILATFLI